MKYILSPALLIPGTIIPIKDEPREVRVTPFARASNIWRRFTRRQTRK